MKMNEKSTTAFPDTQKVNCILTKKKTCNQLVLMMSS